MGEHLRHTPASERGWQQRYAQPEQTYENDRRGGHEDGGADNAGSPVPGRMGARGGEDKDGRREEQAERPQKQPEEHNGKKHDRDRAPRPVAEFRPGPRPAEGAGGHTKATPHEREPASQREVARSQSGRA